MYWNSMKECKARDHPDYKMNTVLLCFGCDKPINPDDVIEYLACQRSDGTIEIGPIVAHVVCLDKG